MTAARKAEAEAEHYKEVESASAKGAQGIASDLLEELAAIKAVANKALGSQQDQKKGKQGDSKKMWKAQGPVAEERILELAMAVVEQVTSSETAPIPIGSL